MKKLLTALCLVALSATVASADILWDQSNWTTAVSGFQNYSATSCSMISGNSKIHAACDVTFSTDVVINSITIYETSGQVEASTQAYLWIAPKTGPLPTESSSLVNVSTNLKSYTWAYVTNGAENAVAVTVSGLSIALPAGSYWVSLAPKHSRGLYPWSVLCATNDAVLGDPTPSIVACTVNSNWLYPMDPEPRRDGAIKVEGTAVVATESEAWGGIKALYR